VRAALYGAPWKAVRLVPAYVACSLEVR
jgi:hypothetical protein